MKSLSGLDATFLYLETPETPMHVGSLHLFALPEGYRGEFYEDLKKHIATRMHLAPLFTRKLALMPFELANPVWIEDEDIDLDYHIRRIVLSRPGSMAQMESYVGRLHSSLMDRSRPLWEFYVIEGLRDGHVGFYTKVHHAAIDGQAGVAVANSILDVSAQPRDVKPAQRRTSGKYQLGVAELLGAALTNQLQQYVKLARLLPAAAKAVSASAGGAIRTRLKLRGAAGAAAASTDGAGKKRSNWKLGPRTPLNVAITNQRSFATVSLPLAQAKAVGKAFDATINDVVLALCSSALRRYLKERGELPARSLTAAVPVSLRAAGDTSQNNQATMSLVNLATEVADPLQRLQAVMAAAAAMKQNIGSFKAVIPTDYPSLGAPWLLSGLAALYGRSKIADKMPPIANVAISNVPGPQMPLYMAGARMLTYYPASIVVHGMALNITVQSYNGSLDFGLIACRRAAPELQALAGYLRDALAELVTLAEQRPATSPEPVRAGAKATATRAKRPAKVAAPATAAPPAKKVAPGKVATPVKKVASRKVTTPAKVPTPAKATPPAKATLTPKATRRAAVARSA